MKFAVLSLVCAILGFLATAVYAAYAPVPETDQGKEVIGFIMVCFIGLAFVSAVSMISIAGENWIRKTIEKKSNEKEIHRRRTQADAEKEQSQE